jgi:hypothetical protein
MQVKARSRARLGNLVKRKALPTDGTLVHREANQVFGHFTKGTSNLRDYIEELIPYKMKYDGLLADGVFL